MCEDAPDHTDGYLRTVAAAVPRAGEADLVPVRLGGPWKDDGGKPWELWREGKFEQYHCGGFRNHNGRVEYEDHTGYWNGIWGGSKPQGIEFRPPKDWRGLLPEGCCLATDFVVGQRVRWTSGEAGCRTGIITSVGRGLSVLLDNGGDMWWAKRYTEGY